MDRKSLPNEIEKSRALLAEFERSTDYPRGMGTFEKAITMLNKYLEKYPSSPFTQLVANTKLSHTRVLLQSLKDIKDINPEIWFEYHRALLQVSNEVDRVLAEDPLLKKEYKEFLEYAESSMRERSMDNSQLTKLKPVRDEKISEGATPGNLDLTTPVGGHIMTIQEAAYSLLLETGKPMSAKQLARMALDRHMVSNQWC